MIVCMSMHAAVLLLIDIAKNIKMFMTVKATSYICMALVWLHKCIQHGRISPATIT